MQKTWRWLPEKWMNRALEYEAGNFGVEKVCMKSLLTTEK